MNYQKWLLASAIAAIAGSVTIAGSAIAQSNQSDITPGNSYNPHGSNWSFSPGNSGITLTFTNGGTTVTGQGSSGTGGTTGTDETTFEVNGVPTGFNLPSGIIDIITASTTGPGTGASTNGDTGVANAPDLDTAMGTRRATGDFNVDGNADSSTSSTEGNLPNSNCESEICLGQQGDEVELTFNEIAELIQSDLDRTVEQLAAAEAKAKQLENEPRRIARSSSLSENEVCPNPAFAAAQARQARKTLQDKLDDTKMFIEQMELINPDSNIW